MPADSWSYLRDKAAVGTLRLQAATLYVRDMARRQDAITWEQLYVEGWEDLALYLAIHDLIAIGILTGPDPYNDCTKDDDYVWRRT